VETADSLSLAFLVLLESLGPVERAVFLLREVFGYGYDEIAGVVGRSEELLRAAKGDPELFGVFYDRHVRTILGFFFRRTASPETAADITAETFAEAFRSRRRYRDTGTPARAWLLAIARRQLARSLRRGRVENRARRRLGVEPVAMDELSYERIEEIADLEPVR
jgi:DNA-directed RNA polymerase specialized sigma24 family protein